MPRTLHISRSELAATPNLAFAVSHLLRPGFIMVTSLQDSSAGLGRVLVFADFAKVANLDRRHTVVISTATTLPNTNFVRQRKTCKSRTSELLNRATTRRLIQGLKWQAHEHDAMSRATCMNHAQRIRSTDGATVRPPSPPDGLWEARRTPDDAM